jgi:hypothetical protein
VPPLVPAAPPLVPAVPPVPDPELQEKSKEEENNEAMTMGKRM